MNYITEGRSIGDIVNSNYNSTKVFAKYGINFWDNNNRSLKDICERNKVDIQKILNELVLASVKEIKPTSLNFNTWSIELLIEYITSNYHNYIKNKLPQLIALSQHIIDTNNELPSEFIKVNQTLKQFAEKVFLHINVQEQKMLFPNILQLIALTLSGVYIQSKQLIMVLRPIIMLEYEHKDLGRDLNQIIRLTNYFTAPENASDEVLEFYTSCKEFEKQFSSMVHLEKNVLYPKAKKLRG